jgi:hypothetical protein
MAKLTAKPKGSPMKKCTYCGRENADDAARCHECGTSFVSQTEDRDAVADPCASAKKKMFTGGVLFCGGVLVAVASTAAGGGPGFLVLACIVFGAVQFCRGLKARGIKATPDDLAFQMLSYGTQLEGQGRVDEALAAYYRVLQENPFSNAGKDAQKSIDSLQGRRARPG